MILHARYSYCICTMYTPQSDSTMSSWIFNGYENKMMKEKCIRHEAQGMGNGGMWDNKNQPLDIIIIDERKFKKKKRKWV